MKLHLTAFSLLLATFLFSHISNAQNIKQPSGQGRSASNKGNAEEDENESIETALEHAKQK
jgi:hypothetical protein